LILLHAVNDPAGFFNQLADIPGLIFRRLAAGQGMIGPPILFLFSGLEFYFYSA
jgi:hypothetical protein